MCGIVGLVGQPAFEDSVLEVGIRFIAPRGLHLTRTNDSFGQLAYSRLPTDDVHNTALAELPVRNGSRLLFNGLITNVDELVATFGLSSDALSSDTICLHEGLNSNGPAFLNHVRGMFAFALVTKESVTLGRDGAGIKPMYFFASGANFGFASDVKALLPASKDITELKPGFVATFDTCTGRSRLSRITCSSERTYEPDELLQSIRDATVPPTVRYLEQSSNSSVALVLRGDVGSSILGQILKRYLPAHMRSRIISFVLHDEYDGDMDIASRTAESLGFRSVVLARHSPRAIRDRLPTLANIVACPEETALISALECDVIAQALRKYGIRVVIAGDGGPELFYGHRRFIDGLSARYVRNLHDEHLSRVLPATVLQPYDRITSLVPAEGRFPLLDQRVVNIARSLPFNQKVAVDPTSGELVDQVALRELARFIGVPAWVHDRYGGRTSRRFSGRHNDGSGYYLSQVTSRAYNKSLDEFASSRFRNLLGTASLCSASGDMTDPRMTERSNDLRNEPDSSAFKLPSIDNTTPSLL